MYKSTSEKIWLDWTRFRLVFLSIYHKRNNSKFLFALLQRHSPSSTENCCNWTEVCEYSRMSTNALLSRLHMRRIQSAHVLITQCIINVLYEICARRRFKATLANIAVCSGLLIAMLMYKQWLMTSLGEEQSLLSDTHVHLNLCLVHMSHHENTPI